MKLPPTLRVVTERIRCWAPIGLRDEQQLIDVRLRTASESIDVHANHAVASLVPLVIAIGREGITGGELAFIDRRTGSELATLQLREWPEHAQAGDTRIRGLSVLQVSGGQHYCLPAGLRTWHRLRQANWRRKPGFHMANSSIQQLTMFYICPRPVVLVSVDDGANNNLFPMDLIGQLGDRFTLALRSTSPSVITMRESRRVALADMALSLKNVVYRLGDHHRLAKIDWSKLPFAAMRSGSFGLRVPEESQRIRECTIEDIRVVGSHHLFVCRVVSESRLADEPCLHHTSGIHRAYRLRSGELPWHESDVPSVNS